MSFLAGLDSDWEEERQSVRQFLSGLVAAVQLALEEFGLPDRCVSQILAFYGEVDSGDFFLSEVQQAQEEQHFGAVAIILWISGRFMPSGAPLPREPLPLIPLLRLLVRRRRRTQRLRRWFQWTVSCLTTHHRSALHHWLTLPSWRSAERRSAITPILTFLRRALFRRLAPSPTATYLRTLDLIDQQVVTTAAAHFPELVAARLCEFLGVDSGHLGPFEDL